MTGATSQWWDRAVTHGSYTKLRILTAVWQREIGNFKGATV